MSDLAEPIPVDGPQGGALTRALSARLNLTWSVVAVAALAVIGAGFRFWDLGSRALHHDESLHGFYAFQLFESGDFQHNPLLHGPFQFFGMAATFFLTGGASDYTVRVFPALFGVILIVLPFFLRHRIGALGAVFAAGIIALSPTLMYFSRFARNDIYIAVFTLALVVCLWRYVDERKPQYLYIAAGVLGLSFATKENTFLQVAVLLAFLNTWLAVEFTQRTREAHKLDPASTVGAFLVYMVWAWVLAAIWRPLESWRPGRELLESLGLREMPPAADFLLVLGVLTLPQLSAAMQEVFRFDTDLPQDAGFLGLPDEGLPIVLAFLAATALVGLAWDPKRFLIIAAAFYVPYVLLYTSFLQHSDGFGSGIWGSLDYWLDEQTNPGPPRGDQPWFYYLMLLPSYEFLPLVVAAPALFYYAYRGDVFRRFLVFWVVGTFAMYIWAGEKMPWLSTHTTLPVVILGAYVLGDVFSRLPAEDKFQRIAPQALPFAAAGLGLAAVGFAAFGPSGGTWILLRVFAASAALGGLVFLLAPYDRRRLTVGITAAVVGGLALFTVRDAILASYEHGDVPRELLVYTQTSPDVPDVMERIQEAGRSSGLGEAVPIYVDNTYAWPWHWYLRDYTAVEYGTPGPEFDPEDNAIVLVASEHESAMQPFTADYLPGATYSLRWWFPEFSTYKTRPTKLREAPEFLGEFVGDLFRPGAWEVWWDYFRDREPPDALGSANFVAYFPLAYDSGEAPPPPPPEATPVPTEPPATVPPPSLDAEGRLVFGGRNSDPGGLIDPTGLTADADGNIYVADTGNDRIQKFDANGELLAEVGGTGAEPGQFNQPADIALDAAGNVYVVDTWNHRIQVFDPELNFLRAWGSGAGDLVNPEPGQMWGPRAIAIEADGNVLIVDTGTNRVRRFSPEGEELKVIGARGSIPGQFSEPVGVAVTPDGDIWIADSGNFRIQRFDSDLEFVAEYAPEQWQGMPLDSHPYIAPLGNGVIASDPAGARVIVIDGAGNVVGTAEGFPEVAFSFPRGVETAGRFVYVTEPGNGQVLRFLATDLPAP